MKEFLYVAYVAFGYTAPSFPSSDPTPDWADAHIISPSGGSFLHLPPLSISLLSIR